MNIEELKAQSLFNFGEENVNFAEHFDGTSYLGAISLDQVPTFNVSFEPGCRNHWHIHHAEEGGGQMLLVTAGRGWYQEWGGEARELHAGDVVNIPANVKHWHGAAADTAFQHIAIEVPGTGASTEWCEPVDPQDYANLDKR